MDVGKFLVYHIEPFVDILIGEELAIECVI